MSEPSAEMRVVLGGGVDGAPEVAAPPATVLLGVGETAEVPLADLFRDPGRRCAGIRRVVVGAERGIGVCVGRDVDDRRALARRGGGLGDRHGPGRPVGADGTAGGGALRRRVVGAGGRRGGGGGAAGIGAPIGGDGRLAGGAGGDPATVDADEGEHGGAFGEATIAAGRGLREDRDSDRRRRRRRTGAGMVRRGAGACAGRGRVRQRWRASACRWRCWKGCATARRPCATPWWPRRRATAAANGRRRRTWRRSARWRWAALAWRRWRPATSAGFRICARWICAATRWPALAAEAVADAPALERLLLGGNALAAVPRQALAALPRLRDLDLSGNALQALPAGVFAGLTLRQLRLDGNPGAPFALAVELERVDAEPWAPPPATIRASVPGRGAVRRVGAAVGAGRDVRRRHRDGADDGAGWRDGRRKSRRAVGGRFRAGVGVRVRPRRPRRCLDGPCWRGFALTAGEPLALFVRGPQALTVSAPEALFGSALRLPLAALAAPAEAGGELSWRASSSDASVATVRIIGGSLLVEPEPGAEGTVLVEVTATDANGQKATVRFEVEVEFHWRARHNGWRLELLED